MSKTYKAIGINLKSAPLGESDRLLTVLTSEFGLIRAISPGSRKHQSTLRGRSGLFVVNELLIVEGKSLDKIIQAEGLRSFPGLSQDLKKLTAGQYLAELALCLALNNHPQEELFTLLITHLNRLESLPAHLILPSLIQAIYQFLVLEGIAPRLHTCCLSQTAIVPDPNDPHWRVGFSAAAGGTVLLSALHRQNDSSPSSSSPSSQGGIAKEASGGYRNAARAKASTRSIKEWVSQLTSTQLLLLQDLAGSFELQENEPQSISVQQGGVPFPQHPSPLPVASDQMWISIEQVLRHYAQYHFEQPIRSAALIDTAFAPVAHPFSAVSHHDTF